MRVNIILIKDSDYNLESIDNIQVSSISEISKIAKQKWSMEDIMKGEVVYDNLDENRYSIQVPDLVPDLWGGNFGL